MVSVVVVVVEAEMLTVPVVSVWLILRGSFAIKVTDALVEIPRSVVLGVTRSLLSV